MFSYRFLGLFLSTGMRAIYNGMFQYLGYYLQNPRICIIRNGAGTHQARALALAQGRALLRTRDFAAAGVPRATLSRLIAEGALQRTARGIYMTPEADISAHFSLAEAALAIPRGVIVLASALRFHELTTQLPHQVWIMLPSKAWTPTAPPTALRIFRTRPNLLMFGVEHHVIDGVRVPITNPARTIVDCFKHRNSIGLDVAIEALRDGLRQRKTTHAELSRYAAVLRMERVMRPYQQALIE